ncbi:MAG: insulinase family protein, partial [Candidatus Rokuibacteriota bacterium]
MARPGAALVVAAIVLAAAEPAGQSLSSIISPIGWAASHRGPAVGRHPAPAAAATVALAHREVMPNGLVLLVAERPAVPIVVVRVWQRAGAVFDPDDRAGLANLTGAVLTRGAGRRTARQIDEAIEFVGGSLEAGAGRDGLIASLSVLARDLGLGLDLLRDVVLVPTFPDDEVKRKVAEIQAAIKRSEQNPETVAARALARLVFPSHPYGRPVEGTRESVARLTRDDVTRFYRDHARPDTTIVGVVGAVTVGDARRAVAARFGGLSVREREVAVLIARGLTNREIADELVVGERTIET